MSRKAPTYDECYALVILQECLNMTDLEVSDRPDIRCNNQVGIEVVSALFEDDKRLESIIKRRQEGKKSDPIPEGYIETPYCFMHPEMVSKDCMKTNKYDRSISDAVKLIKSAIDKKTKKVSKYDCETDRLFLFAELCIDDDTLKSIGEDVYQYASDTFKILYILARDSNCLMVCDANGVSLHYHQEKQYEYSLLAYDIYKRECAHE